MKRHLLVFLFFSFLVASCAGTNATAVQQTAIADSIIQQIGVKETEVAFALTPTITPTPLPPTLTPTATNTPQPTATATWVTHTRQEKLIVPILLYHHVRVSDTPGRYDIAPDVFQAQMTALKEWGYQAITISQLIDTLRYGGQLPEKSVVITFDDGTLDVYQNAFPIMKEMGFVGTFYIVANRLKSADFVHVTEIREMIGSGWEIGSHSFSHSDLTKNYGSIDTEALHSKRVLQDAIGLPINTFAYPYGAFDAEVGRKVSSYGYNGAVGLGTSYIHSIYSVFYLSRMEVQGNYDMNKFASMLPWSPVTTPVPLQ